MVCEYWLLCFGESIDFAGVHCTMTKLACSAPFICQVFIKMVWVSYQLKDGNQHGLQIIVPLDM